MSEPSLVASLVAMQTGAFTKRKEKKRKESGVAPIR
jgi:hypothetical protein